MKVVGLTEALHGAAQEQCGEGFRAWRVEVAKFTWGNWEEMEKHFPKACRVDEDEAHFPLHANGTGVRARIFFPLNLLILLRIAPCPAGVRIVRRTKLSISTS